MPGGTTTDETRYERRIDALEQPAWTRTGAPSDAVELLVVDAADWIVSRPNTH